jgi:hypothetical protein
LQVRELKAKRAKAMELLLFVEEVVQYQHQRGRAVVVENPQRSLLWAQAPIMCMYEKRRPDTKEWIKKPTVFKETAIVCEEVRMACDGSHKHGTIMGGWQRGFVFEDPEGKKLTVSEWAGGYTEMLAKKLLSGAVKFLTNHSKTTVSFPVDEAEVQGEQAVLDEEHFMDADDEVQDDWSSNELPKAVRAELYEKIPKEIRQGVRKAHIGLGHPSRGTFLRMLRLGGATPAAVEYAKAWICPVCAASSAPGRPLEASVRARPFGFNKVVCLDLKCQKDAAQKNHVALSAMDAGTRVA